jgi:hypothetical protein
MLKHVSCFGTSVDENSLTEKELALFLLLPRR